MPEVHFRVRWPDGREHRYYSPSTTVREHLTRGERYSVSEFVERARTAMHVASERVRAKYGYACSSALDTLAQIEETAAEQPPATSEWVTVIEVE